MTNEIVAGEQPTSLTDTGMERRGLLRFGSLITAVTGASAMTALGAGSAQAADAQTAVTYIPVSEKAAPSGVAALDANAKIIASQLPDLSATVTASTVYRAGVELRITDLNKFSLGPTTTTTWTTPDGSGVVAHPTVRFFPNGFNGYHWWAAATPYANSDNQLENPCIYVSTDGTNWTAPLGLTNPLVPAPPGGYNSDTHLIQAPEGKLLLFYREYSSRLTNAEKIMLTESVDGITWTTPVKVLGYSDTVKRLMSPAVWWDASALKWVMVGVEILAQPRIVQRFTASNPYGPWTYDQDVKFDLPWGTGKSPWHIDAMQIGSQVLMVIQDAAANSGGGDVYLALSEDNGKTFNRATNPIATANRYRSCVLPKLTENGLALDLWLGTVGGTWTINRGTAAVPATAAPAMTAQSLTAAAVRVVGPTTFPPKPVVAPLTTFQAGHGWGVASMAGGTNFTADTTDFLIGTQSIKATTNGTGGTVEIISPALSPLNLTGKGIAFQLKVDNPDRLANVILFWGQNNYASFNTSIQAESQGTGASAMLLPTDWTWFYVPANDFSNKTGTVDLSSITNLKIRVTDKNAGPLNVNVQQIGIYTPKNAYPDGVLSVTCDDSLLSQYTYLPQILGKYGAAATMLLIADQMAGSPVFGSNPSTYVQGFNVDQAHELEDKHGYEMGGHAYLTANHNRGMPSLSPQELADELGGLKAWLRSEGFKASDYFAWPVGANDVASTKIARKFFSWARHTGGYYAPAGFPTQPMRHQAVSVTSDTPLATYKSYIDFAKAHGRHLTLMVHQIVASGASGGTNVNKADLVAILDYAASLGMPIRTIGQVMRSE
ncbi:polysaccharide deacetylase family protein [Pseudarthrobacter sp. LT1]|uniref:polysaccharide deacetylase family protein n=1 Tax=Pseudarthrobacter sp. LT1 TaxID=3111450 RepID=UPI002D78936A|nr:polysaccharide deacetylase family protein [Pseudarthrobacter sp. LT1]WRT14641.1 polysaccharide deacetylase family protein [Pseudarthrobacter sp. LT1]